MRGAQQWARPFVGLMLCVTCGGLLTRLHLCNNAGLKVEAQGCSAAEHACLVCVCAAMYMLVVECQANDKQPAHQLQLLQLQSWFSGEDAFDCWPKMCFVVSCICPEVSVLCVT